MDFITLITTLLYNTNINSFGAPVKILQQLQKCQVENADLLRVAHIHAANVCEKFVNFERIFCMNPVNIMVNLFHCFFKYNLFFGTSFPHGKSVCKTAESSTLREKELPPPATPPLCLWALCCAVLTAFWSSVCSRSLLPVCVCTSCSCLHFF